MTQETKSPAEQMDVREALISDLENWATYGTMIPERRRQLLDAVAALRSPAVSAGEPVETCGVCCGSGYSNHPDSGEICASCNGQGVALPPSNPPGDWKAICDSYAEENQRLSDQLEAANAKLANPPGAEPPPAVCKACDGSGEIFRGIGGPDDPERCHVCDGTGEQPAANPPVNVREKVIEECIQLAKDCNLKFYPYNSSGMLAHQIDQCRADFIAALTALASPKDAAAAKGEIDG